MRGSINIRARVRGVLADSAKRRSSIIAALQNDGGPAIDEADLDAILNGSDPEIVHEARGWWKYVASNGKEAAS